MIKSAFRFIAAALVLSAVVSVITYSCTRRSSAPPAAPQSAGIMDTPTRIIYRDREGVTHIQYKNQPEPATREIIRYAKDTLAPALKIASDKITELSRINATLEGQVKAITIQKNAAEGQTAYYKTKFLEVITNSADSSLYYKYHAQINIARYPKRRFLQPVQDWIDISSPDTNFRINGVERYSQEVSRNRKFLLYSYGQVRATLPEFNGWYFRTGIDAQLFPDATFSPYVGAGYMYEIGRDQKPQPFLQSGFRLNLIRF